jgi:hypothetical protein
MAAILDFLAARKLRHSGAVAARAPRLVATWALTDQGKLLCTWCDMRSPHGPAEPASANEAGVHAGRRLAA